MAFESPVGKSKFEAALAQLTDVYERQTATAQIAAFHMERATTEGNQSSLPNALNTSDCAVALPGAVHLPGALEMVWDDSEVFDIDEPPANAFVSNPEEDHPPSGRCDFQVALARLAELHDLEVVGLRQENNDLRLRLSQLSIAASSVASGGELGCVEEVRKSLDQAVNALTELQGASARLGAIEEIRADECWDVDTLALIAVLKKDDDDDLEDFEAALIRHEEEIASLRLENTVLCAHAAQVANVAKLTASLQSATAGRISRITAAAWDPIYPARSGNPHLAGARDPIYPASSSRSDNQWIASKHAGYFDTSLASVITRTAEL